MNLLMAVFGGTMLGSGAVFVVEMFNQRVRTTESLLVATGLPVLVEFTQGLEPSAIRRWLKKSVDAVLEKFKFRKALATA
jgi:hypothetical protein